MKTEAGLRDQDRGAVPQFGTQIFILFLCLVFAEACSSPKPETPGSTDNAHQYQCASLTTPAWVTISGGSFEMGSNPVYPEEGPVRSVSVSNFEIRSHEVTNRDFVEFVEQTGYMTMAERQPDPADHPDIPAEYLVPGSAVFVSPLETPDKYWWQFVAGAHWRTPEGPGSDIYDRMRHPVVHIAYEDAHAYARWAGGALPTEAQWEFAARGGLERAPYEWGETHPDAGDVRANTWQGAFPIENSVRDGFARTSPTGCYQSNGYGLFDMTGNVWEWVLDEEPGDGNSGRLKGGSFLCADNYCRRFRPSARQAQELDFSASHIGFRIVRSAPQ